MTDLGILATVIGAVGAVCAIVFGYTSYKRNQKADDSKSGKESGTLFTEIGYIKSGIDDIKRKQDKQDERLNRTYGNGKRRGVGKASHKRLDNIGHHNPREE